MHVFKNRVLYIIFTSSRRIWTFFVKIVNNEKPPRTPFLQNTYHWLPSKTVRENTVNKSRRNWVKNTVLNQIKTEISRIAVTFLPKILRAFNVHSIKKHNISIWLRCIFFFLFPTVNSKISVTFITFVSEWAFLVVKSLFPNNKFYLYSGIGSDRHETFLYGFFNSTFLYVEHSYDVPVCPSFICVASST